MKHICETLFRLKELLEISLKLEDVKLRKLINDLVSDMNKATEEVNCIDNSDTTKEAIISYII